MTFCPCKSVVDIHSGFRNFRTLDIMSECDNPDEHCETSRIREEKAMGDVQEHTEDDSQRDNPSPECPRQEADGAPEFFVDEPSPTDTPSSDSVEVRFSLFHIFLSAQPKILTLSQFSSFPLSSPCLMSLRILFVKKIHVCLFN